MPWCQGVIGNAVAYLPRKFAVHGAMTSKNRARKFQYAPTPCGGLPEIEDHRIAGKREEKFSGNQMTRRIGHHHMHIIVEGGQSGAEIRRFVCAIPPVTPSRIAFFSAIDIPLSIVWWTFGTPGEGH